MFLPNSSNPDSIGESLEEYAKRTNRSQADAYPEWHEHGNRTAAEWSSRPAAEPRLDILGARCFGIHGRGLTAGR